MYSRKSIQQIIKEIVPALLMALVATGCSPPEDERLPFSDNLPGDVKEEDQRKAFVLIEEAKKSDVLQMVKEAPSLDRAGTTEDWIHRQMDSIPGQTLFPQWDVVRKTSNKYEVRYTYMLVDASNKLACSGFQWTVDVSLKQVSDPQEMKREEIVSRTNPATSAEQSSELE